jgi:diguanylate cyclase (GGDEF)-like protein/PAS domain S-box-containing protein
MGQALLDFAEAALKAVGVGCWHYVVATGELRWTDTTFLIHDLEPDRVPTLAEAIAFYAPEARSAIGAAVGSAVSQGTPFDVELPLITAKGRRIQVRACGRAVRRHGRTVELTGTFQNVTASLESARRSALLSLVCQQMANTVVVTNSDGRIEWVNAAFEELSGYALADIRGQGLSELLPNPHADPATVAHMDRCLANGEAFDVEMPKCMRDGRILWFAVNATPLRDASGTLTGHILIGADITRRRNAEAAAQRNARDRKRSEALLRDVMETLPLGVLAWDENDRFLMCNAAYGDMFPVTAGCAIKGYRRDHAILAAALAGEYPEAGETPAQRVAWANAFTASQMELQARRTLQLSDGRFVQAQHRRSESGNLVCVRTDTTDLMRAEAELRAQAERDPLTAIANRVALRRALDMSLVTYRDMTVRTGTHTGALLLFDLDDFKLVNDRFGHDVGDALLLEIADRLRAHTRAQDLAARLGGDEFAVLMPGLDDERAVRARVDEIHAALSAPAQIGPRRLRVTISGGVTLFPGDGGDAAALLKNADLALYDAKRAGRAQWCRFRPELAAAE